MDDHRDVEAAKRLLLEKALKKAKRYLAQDPDYLAAYGILRDALEDYLYNAY